MLLSHSSSLTHPSAHSSSLLADSILLLSYGCDISSSDSVLCLYNDCQHCCQGLNQIKHSRFLYFYLFIHAFLMLGNYITLHALLYIRMKTKFKQNIFFQNISTLISESVLRNTSAFQKYSYPSTFFTL